MKEVFINKLSKFLPNDPVSNDEMESYLGYIDGKPSRGRGMVLRSNGIKTRYYALDKTGKPNYTNAGMAAEAIRALFDDRISIDKMEVLAAGTTSQDQILPSHASMIHGELQCQPVELVSTTGACCSGTQALKYAFMAVKSGDAKYAVSVGSERFSTLMSGSKFQPEADNLSRLQEEPIIAFEKDFLRWMLSDGASAALLTDQPNEEGISLRIDWIEISSFASEIEACMYSGAYKNGTGELHGWMDLTPEVWANKSIFAIKQDVKILGNNIVQLGARMLKTIVDKRNFDVSEIDYFLPHLSSEYFRDKVKAEMDKNGFDIPAEKWFTNLSRVGNVGSASIYFMLEELVASGDLKPGMKILLMVPESARFSYAYALLTVV